MTLDRLVDLQLPHGVRDSTGGRAAGPPQQSIQVWAAKDDMTARRVLASGREDNAMLATFTINWREGLTDSWQIVYRGQTYRVLGVADRGRRRFLDVLTEVVT